MRYFSLLDFQHWVVTLFFGLLLVILIYVAWRLYPLPKDADGSTPPDDHLPGSNPFPPILILISAGALLWALGYVIIEGILGGAFG